MKVLIIPDIHLKPHIFCQAGALMERGVAEQAVCLMDLPDDWGQEYHISLYEETFDEAIIFAKKYPNTLWVYGNHDLCYLWDERESGYSATAAPTVREKLAPFSALGREHKIDCSELMRFSNPTLYIYISGVVISI